MNFSYFIATYKNGTLFILLNFEEFWQSFIILLHLLPISSAILVIFYMRKTKTTLLRLMFAPCCKFDIVKQDNVTKPGFQQQQRLMEAIL